jgi:hypothetical protein
MSFGISISDVVILIQLTSQAYRGWKNACGEYTKITGELNSLTAILRRIETEANVPGSILARQDVDYGDLIRLMENCSEVVTELDDIVKRYKSLGMSRRKNLDRFRLGNKNLGDLRDRLTLHVSALSAYLSTIGVGASGAWR